MANRATNRVHDRVVLVFDFDETLGPDTYNALLAHLGFDPEPYRADHLQPLVDDGWDEMLAKYFLVMKEAAARDDLQITRDDFRAVARELPLYPGVREMFQRIRDYARDLLPDVQVVFHLLTGGMLEIPRQTPIAGEFEKMWGGELLFDDAGHLSFVKRAIDDPDKERYLLKLAKGIALDDPQRTQDVKQPLPRRDWYVPFDQLVYVGDGSSDMPAYELLNESGAIAIGVFKADAVSSWEGYEDVRQERKVENLAPVDYREGSEALTSILLAVDSVCKRIAIRRQSRGE